MSNLPPPLNIRSRRAEKACTSCHTSHKKCHYVPANGMCARCSSRGIVCSLTPTTGTLSVAPESMNLPEVSASANTVAQPTPSPSEHRNIYTVNYPTQYASTSALEGVGPGRIHYYEAASGSRNINETAEPFTADFEGLENHCPVHSRPDSRCWNSSRCNFGRGMEYRDGEIGDWDVESQSAPVRY
ncbi:hypothetical protein BJ138DRAFT_693337 [Hygrophoropsis aurantiaca]|uniref:Uncharacterized protein n=1 Tax=Hygrophoropsis aurantiaca TaxID=72124 RepID=A0ACB8AS62_9AGAM|nr:hypothetical protein BJ138DRAFT_693337 [Hygrophoropsis aurantiaca]